MLENEFLSLEKAKLIPPEVHELFKEKGIEVGAGYTKEASDNAVNKNYDFIMLLSKKDYWYELYCPENKKYMESLHEDHVILTYSQSQIWRALPDWVKDWTSSLLLIRGDTLYPGKKHIMTQTQACEFWHFWVKIIENDYLLNDQLTIYFEMLLYLWEKELLGCGK